MAPKRKLNTYSQLGLNSDKILKIINVLKLINKMSRLVETMSAANYIQLGKSIDYAENLLSKMQNPSATITDLSGQNPSDIRSLKDLLFEETTELFQQMYNTFYSVSKYKKATNEFTVADLKKMDQYWAVLIKNMMVYLKLLNTFRTYMCSIYLHYTQKYTDELTFIQKNFAPALLWADRDLTLNFWFTGSGERDNFVTLATLYTSAYNFLHNCFSNPKFSKNLMGKLSDQIQLMSDLAAKKPLPVKRAVPYNLFDSTTLEQQVLADSGDIYFEKSIFNMPTSVNSSASVISEILKMGAPAKASCFEGKGGFDRDQFETTRSIQPLKIFDMDLQKLKENQIYGVEESGVTTQVLSNLVLSMREYHDDLKFLIDSGADFSNRKLPDQVFSKGKEIVEQCEQVLDIALSDAKTIYQDLGIMPLSQEDVERVLDNDMERLNNFKNLCEINKNMDNAVEFAMRAMTLLPALANKMQDYLTSINKQAELVNHMKLSLNVLNCLNTSGLNFHLETLRTGSFMIQNFLPVFVCDNFYKLISFAPSWMARLKTKFQSSQLQINGLVVTSLEEIILKNDVGFFDNSSLLERYAKLNSKSIQDLFKFSEFALYNIIKVKDTVPQTSQPQTIPFLKRKRPFSSRAEALTDSIRMNDREMDYTSVSTDDTSYSIKIVTTPAINKSAKSGSNMIYQWLFGSFETTLILALLEGSDTDKEIVVEILRDMLAEPNYTFQNGQQRVLEPDSVAQLLETNIVRLFVFCCLFSGVLTYDSQMKIAKISNLPPSLVDICNSIKGKSKFVARLAAQYQADVKDTTVIFKLDSLTSTADTRPFHIDEQFYVKLKEFAVGNEFPNLLEFVSGGDATSKDYPTKSYTLVNSIDLSGKFSLLQRLKKTLFTTISLHDVTHTSPSFCLTQPLHEAEHLEILFV